MYRPSDHRNLGSHSVANNYPDDERVAPLVGIFAMHKSSSSEMKMGANKQFSWEMAEKAKTKRPPGGGLSANPIGA
jgi:hypothetical protein